MTRNCTSAMRSTSSSTSSAPAADPERTIQEYRKKLDLFQRWVAASRVDKDAVDAPYLFIGAGEVETYIVHLKECGLSDTSRKGHLAVLRSFFSTLEPQDEATGPDRRSG